MSDIITPRLLVVATIWAIFSLIGNPPPGTGIGFIAGIAGRFIGSILLMAILKKAWQKASGVVTTDDTPN